MPKDPETLDQALIGLSKIEEIINHVYHDPNKNEEMIQRWLDACAFVEEIMTKLNNHGYNQ